MGDVQLGPPAPRYWDLITWTDDPASSWTIYQRSWIPGSSPTGSTDTTTEHFDSTVAQGYSTVDAQQESIYVIGVQNPYNNHGNLVQYYCFYNIGYPSNGGDKQVIYTTLSQYQWSN